MSAWNHSLCEDCYDELAPDRVPVRLTRPTWETCCLCGTTHMSGIFYRGDPNEFEFCKHA